MKIISIANDFSVFPGGRLKKNGNWSGEEFRESILIPAINAGEPFVIDMDGVKGYPPSFLEEAFGGLVRGGYSEEKLRSIMSLKCSRQSRIEEVWYYIKTEADQLQVN